MKKTSPKKSKTPKIVEVNAMTPKESCSSCACGSCKSCCCAGWGLMVLRFVVGLVFIFAGWPKILGMPALLGLPGFVGSIVGVIEVLAGIALIVGIMTKWAGYLLAAIMAVAIIGVHLKLGWASVQFPLVLFAAALALAWNGPGVWSLHEKCGCCKDCC